VNWLRPVDIWFLQHVLPHEAHYLRQARRWSRDSHEASDLVQEAYLKLLQMDNWAGIRDPRSYATTTIRNLVLQRVRRSQVVAITDIPSAVLDLRDESPGVFEVVAARDALGDLLAEIDQLPPVCRRVIRMRKLDDLGPREIALALGISVSSVETHLARGMQQLMQWRRRTQQMPAPSEEPAIAAETSDGDAILRRS
jgi:RNA polymerase sigma-70 factor (ECF subfamily)